MTEPQNKRPKFDTTPQKKCPPQWYFDMVMAKRIVLDGKYVIVETEDFDKTILTENKDFTIEDDLVLHKNIPQCRVAPSKLPKLEMKYKLKIKTGMKKVLHDKPFYIVKFNNYAPARINSARYPCHKFGSNHTYDCLELDLKTQFTLEFCRYGEYQYVLRNSEKEDRKYNSKDKKYTPVPELNSTSTRTVILSVHAPTDYQQFYSANKSNFVTVGFQVGLERPNQTCFRNKRGIPLGIVSFSSSEVFPVSAWVTTVPQYKRRVEKITDRLDYKPAWDTPLLLPAIESSDNEDDATESDDDTTNNIDSDDADDN